MSNEFSFRNIIRLTFPTFLSQATIMLVGIVDLYFVGTFGTAAVAALSIAHITWLMIAAFFEGLRLGTTVVASRFFGAQRHEDMYHVARLGLIGASVIGVLLIIFGGHIASLVYQNATQDPAVRELGQQYLPWILASGGFVFITFVIDGMFRGANRVVIPTVITLVTQSVNIALNYVFVRGMFGIVPMGIKGVALATFTAYVTAAICAVAALYFKGFRDVFRRFSTPFREVLREYSRTAIEVGLHSGFRLLAMFIFTVGIVSKMGTSSVAAYQIASQIFQISYLPGLAFMFTMSMLVSNLVGGNQFNYLTHVTKRVSIVALAVASTIGLMVFIFSRDIALVFSPQDAAVAASAGLLIKLVAVNQLISMANFMFRGFLNGVKETTFLVIASLATTYGIFLPLSYFVGTFLGYGVIGAYAITILWTSVDALTNAWRSMSVIKKIRAKAEQEAQ